MTIRFVRRLTLALASVATVTSLGATAVTTPAFAADPYQPGPPWTDATWEGPWTAADLDDWNIRCDFINSLNNLPENKGKGFLCERIFTNPEYQEFEDDKKLTDYIFNFADEDAPQSYSWSETVKGQTSASVSAEAKVSFWKVVEATVTGNYSKTWGESKSFKEDVKFTVPRCSVGWLQRSAEMVRATGGLTFRFNGVWHKYDKKWVVIPEFKKLTFPDASFTGPTGKASRALMSRPLTEAEKARCIPGGPQLTQDTL